MRPISLSFLTAPVSDPLEYLTIAANAGYDGIGLRLHDPVDGTLSPLVTNTRLRAAFIAKLNATGLRVTEIEAWMLRADPLPSTDPRGFEAAAELGQPSLIAVADRVGTVELQQVIDGFSTLCHHAASYDLKVGFEPIAHRVGGTIDDALSVVSSAAHWNAKLVLDALHVHRMGIDPQDMSRLHPALIDIFHICDAPDLPTTMAETIDHSAFNRWLPGEGVLPLDDYLDALAPDLPISLEIPMTRLSLTHSSAERAKMAITAMRRFLELRAES